MQLCIQSYLSEELYFIAVTARTTTGTDVWETLLVNHICSEVLTEKKLDWQSQGWGRRSWRYDVALFPSPSLLHFCISCRFVSRSSLCLFHLYVSHSFFLLVSGKWVSISICAIWICCFSLSFHPLIICVFLHLLFFSIFSSVCPSGLFLCLSLWNCIFCLFLNPSPITCTHAYVQHATNKHLNKMWLENNQICGSIFSPLF